MAASPHEYTDAALGVLGLGLLYELDDVQGFAVAVGVERAGVVGGIGVVIRVGAARLTFEERVYLDSGVGLGRAGGVCGSELHSAQVHVVLRWKNLGERLIDPVHHGGV